jgi:hypothetical protein
MKSDLLKWNKTIEDKIQREANNAIEAQRISIQELNQRSKIAILYSGEGSFLEKNKETFSVHTTRE